MAGLRPFSHTALPTISYQLEHPDTPGASAKARVMQCPEKLCNLHRGVWTPLGLRSMHTLGGRTRSVPSIVLCTPPRLYFAYD